LGWINAIFILLQTVYPAFLPWSRALLPFKRTQINPAKIEIPGRKVRYKNMAIGQTIPNPSAPQPPSRLRGLVYKNVITGLGRITRIKQSLQRHTALAICFKEGHYTASLLRKNLMARMAESGATPESLQTFSRTWSEMGLELGNVLFDLNQRSLITLSLATLQLDSVPQAATGIQRFLFDKGLDVTDQDVILSIRAASRHPSSPVRFRKLRNLAHWVIAAPSIGMGLYWAEKNYARISGKIQSRLDFLNGSLAGAMQRFKDKTTAAITFARDNPDQTQAVNTLTTELARLIQALETREQELTALRQRTKLDAASVSALEATFDALIELYEFLERLNPADPDRLRSVGIQVCKALTTIDPSFRRALFFVVTEIEEALPIEEVPSTYEAFDARAWWAGSQVASEQAGKLFGGVMFSTIEMPKTVSAGSLAAAIELGAWDEVLANIPEAVRSHSLQQAEIKKAEEGADIPNCRCGKVRADYSRPLPGEDASILRDAIETRQPQIRFSICTPEEAPEGVLDGQRTSRLSLAAFNPLKTDPSHPDGTWKAKATMRRTTGRLSGQAMVALPFTIRRRTVAGKIEEQRCVVALDAQGGQDVRYDDPTTRQRILRNLPRMQRAAQLIARYMSHEELLTGLEAVRDAARSLVPAAEAEAVLRGESETKNVSAVVAWLDMVGSTSILGIPAVQQDPSLALAHTNLWMGPVTEYCLRKGISVYNTQGDALLLGLEVPEEEALGMACQIMFDTCVGIQQIVRQINQRLPEGYFAPPIQLRIAMDQGMVAFGPLGGQSQHQLTLIGPAVTRCSRIVGSATPTGIVINHAVMPLLVALDTTANYFERVNWDILQYLLKDSPDLPESIRTTLASQIQSLHGKALNQASPVTLRRQLQQVPLSHFAAKLVIALGYERLLVGFQPIGMSDTKVENKPAGSFKGINALVQLQHFPDATRYRPPHAYWEDGKGEAAELKGKTFEPENPLLTVFVSSALQHSDNTDDIHLIRLLLTDVASSFQPEED
jgi:class 3 adenylate cyclase